MHSHLVVGIGRIHRCRQYLGYLRLQNARYYTPSARHQASNPFPKPRPSRYALPPAPPPKSRQAPAKVSQARQTDGSPRSGRRSRWHDWATEHPFIVKSFVVFLSGTTIICYFVLQRVPITGRRQLNIIPNWVAIWMEKSEREEENELRKQLTNCSWESDHPGMQGVNVIFKRLVRASGLDDRDWEFRVVRAPTIANAGVSPSSGLVLVFSGIFLHAVKSNDELAAVLAHEITHVLANHAVEGKSVMTVAGVFSLPFVPFALLGLLVEEAVIFALPIAFAVSATFYFSRKREQEADYIGMMLMADAGFDPSAAVSVWKKMKQMEDQILSADPRVKQDPQWMSTHPHSASRIRQNEKWIPEILEILGKEPSNEVAVRSWNLAAKRRRWEEFVKERNGLQSINRET